MITKLHIDVGLAEAEFGLRCQRLIPWTRGTEPSLGAMACFLEPRQQSDPDVHDQDEVMVVLDGTGTVTIDGEPTDIVPGDVVVLPRNAVHVVTNPASQILTWISVYWPLHEPRREGHQ